MKYFVFNHKKGVYESKGEYGKNSQEIAKEFGDVTVARVRQYAFENKMPYFGTDTDTFFYVFDDAAEEEFKNRPRQGKHNKYKDRPPKPPKVPGNPGRPRKEALDIVPKKKPIKTKNKK